MKNNVLEEMLNEAVEMLHKGLTKQEVVLKFPENYRETLLHMLEIAEEIKALPKNSAPKPVMQRKYALSPSKISWAAWLGMHKLMGIAAPAAVFALLIAGTSYAALNSVPGQKLFTLKKSGEQIRLKFAISPEAKINLQTSIAKQRLHEVEKILKNPSRSHEMEDVALNELVSATENTIKTLDAAAKNKTLSRQTEPLVSSLEALTAQQEAIVKEIKPESKIAEASQQNSSKLSEVKKLIVAAGQEQTLANLDPGPNTVVVYGIIEKISETQIIVEKTLFNFTESTVIKNDNEQILTKNDLAVQQQINILATRDQDTLLAQRIIIFKDRQEGEVKGEQQEKPVNTTTPESLIKKENVSSSTKESSAPSIEEPQNIDSKDIQGTFIFEDPSPQTNF